MSKLLDFLSETEENKEIYASVRKITEKEHETKQDLRQDMVQVFGHDPETYHREVVIGAELNDINSTVSDENKSIIGKNYDSIVEDVLTTYDTVENAVLANITASVVSDYTEDGKILDRCVDLDEAIGITEPVDDDSPFKESYTNDDFIDDDEEEPADEDDDDEDNFDDDDDESYHGAMSSMMNDFDELDD